MTDPKPCDRCAMPLPADSHANRKYHQECFDANRRDRQRVAGTEEPVGATTRRCRNRLCIERFVPVNQQHWYHEPACAKSRSLWSEAEILKEEGNLLPGSSAAAMAKVAFGQKNTVLRKNAQLTTLRDYLTYEVHSFYDENPEFRIPHPVQIVPREDGPKGEREVIVQLSDWQVGKWENGIGVEGTLERVRDAERAALAIIERTRAAGHPVNRAHVTFGGDMIEGCFIYRGQNVSGLDRTSNTHRLVNQIRTVAHRMAEFVAVMAAAVPDVQVQVVGGNHGRVNGPNDFADPEDNFDVMAAWWAEDLTATHDNVTWNISEDWWHGFESLGQYVVMFHGDQWRGPFARLEKLLPSWVVADVFQGRKPKMVLTHHRHEGAECNIAGIRVIQNGTLDGGSNWYLKNYGGSSTPQQNVIVMSPEYTPEALWPVNFEAVR
jgi:hypothetical protein